MRAERENELLGILLMSPNYLSLDESISENLFSSLDRRRVFRSISEIYEDFKPTTIDIGLLAERTGLSVQFIDGLVDGCYRPDPKNFIMKIHVLKKSRLLSEFMALSKKETDAHMKTDSWDPENMERIRGLWQDLDRLQSLENGLSLKLLASVEPKEIDWLWLGRIPFGMLTLLAGSPGQGKSVLALAAAASLSKGAPLPDSGGIGINCDSLILAAEDPIAQAVRPRAEINGADLSRIFFIDPEDINTEKIFGRLRQALAANPKIKFVVVDPLNAFLKPGTDYFRDPDVRRSLLQPLASLAEETGAAVLGICHLNKRTDDSGALNRIGGSVAYGAAARSVLALGLDPDNAERRLLAPAKCNYSKMLGTIAFTISDGGRVEFEASPIEISADEILQKHDPNRAAEGDFATDWLKDYLKAGPAELQVLLLAAKKVSISRTTLFRVRKKIGVVSRGSGFGQFKISTWELPK